MNYGIMGTLLFFIAVAAVDFLLIVLFKKILNIKKAPLNGAKIYLEAGEDTENLEMILRELSEVAEGYGSYDEPLEVVVINNGIPSEETAVLRLLQNDKKTIKIIKKEELFR